jgi:hypothetical protein
MNDQPSGERLLGGVAATPMPKHFADRLVPHEPVRAEGTRPSGPPVPDRRHDVRVPGDVTIVVPLDPPGPTNDEHNPHE